MPYRRQPIIRGTKPNWARLVYGWMAELTVVNHAGSILGINLVKEIKYMVAYGNHEKVVEHLLGLVGTPQQCVAYWGQ